MTDQVTRVSAARLALLSRQARERGVDVQAVRSEPIAVVGLGCRFPGGVFDADGLWRVLVDGVDAVREVARERFDIDAFYDAEPNAPGKVTTREGGFLDDIERLRRRLLRHRAARGRPHGPSAAACCSRSRGRRWRTPGSPHRRLAGSRTGRVRRRSTTTTISRYQYADLDRDRRLHQLRHRARHRRRAGWRTSTTCEGPRVVVDTACSSSLVAVHLACQSLRSGECDLALAGGTGLDPGPESDVCALVAWGCCRPTAAARHSTPAPTASDAAKGCGVVVLKRLADALAAATASTP